MRIYILKGLQKTQSHNHLSQPVPIFQNSQQYKFFMSNMLQLQINPFFLFLISTNNRNVTHSIAVLSTYAVQKHCASAPVKFISVSSAFFIGFLQGSDKCNKNIKCYRETSHCLNKIFVFSLQMMLNTFFKNSIENSFIQQSIFNI